MPRSRVYSLPLSLLLVFTVAASSAAPSEKPTASSPAPLRLAGIDLQVKGRVRSLVAGERLQGGQDFAVRVTSEPPLYLYVLLEHADARRALLHPRPNATHVPVPAAQRLPQPGDWFFLDKVERGDRLCLIGSERPLSQPSCADDSARPPRDRGEDKPPPPADRKVETPPPPPPPDDKDETRGRKKWVILLPLAAP